MSEPSRSTPARREKLAHALKRNMARRKGVVRDQGSGSEAHAKRMRELRVAAGEPLTGRGQPNTGDTLSVAQRGEANAPFPSKGEAP